MRVDDEFEICELPSALSGLALSDRERQPAIQRIAAELLLLLDHAGIKKKRKKSEAFVALFTDFLTEVWLDMRRATQVRCFLVLV